MLHRKNVNKIISESEHASHISAVEKISGVLGTMRFLQALTLFFLLYIGYNMVNHKPVDPYPFLFLSTFINIMSMYTGPVLLASDRAKSMKDQIKNDHQYEVNIKTFDDTEAIKEELGQINKKLDKLTGEVKF